MAARLGNLLLCIAALVLAAGSAEAQPVIWTSGTFTYDGSGNVTVTGLDTYEYDALSRLKTATADRERTSLVNQQAYTYDAYGNRLTTATSGTGCVGGCAPNVTVDQYNHLSNHSATYDEAGNLKTFDSFTYAYDGSRMLTRQTSPQIDWQYIYTADDERVGTYTGGGNWRFTLRDLDGKVLREVTALQGGGTTTWTRTRDHVYRDGLLLATVAAGGVTEQFHLDHLGTPRLVTNTSGATVGIHTYYPFGDELALGIDETPTESLKFTGHERDVNSINGNSLDYMHARYYSSSQGRFLSVDPAMDIKRNLPEPQRWNRYAYVVNNPIRSLDPDGKADNDFRCVECRTPEAKAAFDRGVTQAMQVGLPIVAGFMVGAEIPALARAAFTAFPRTFMALMGIGGAMTGAPSVNLGSGARPIQGAINVDNMSAGFRGGMQQIQVAGDALALPFKNGSIGNVTAQNLPGMILGQGGQQLAGELGRTMQSGSTLTITTQTPGALQAFGQLLGKTFKDVVIKDGILTAIRQ